MDQQKVIFLNPKFKNAYINPNFLKSNTIHLNPKFLQQQINAQNLPQQSTQAATRVEGKTIVPAVNNSAIIKNTKRSLIRAPAKPECSNSKSFQGQKQIPGNVAKKMNLIKLSNTKLVNASHLMKVQQKENEIIKKATESLIKTKKLMKKSESERSIYKLDRRKLSPGIAKKKRKIVSTYSIRRIDSSDKLTPKKVIVTGHRLLKSGSHLATKNKKMLVIRGQKFVLDPTGTKLKRDNDSNSMKLSRIDIGGLTYKKKLSNGSYERDNSHQVRNHLTIAKTKSISVLQRGKLQISNVICPIYRRLGKCLSYANGRCAKIHDPRYVIVCPNFIKGNCENEKCLLSHNANRHKMPVCKYYLKGLCAKSKDDCLYLHKKLTDGTKLCADFVKGYCPLADKCNLMHDFPDTGNKLKYSIVRKKKVSPERKKEIEVASNTNDARYFDDASSSSSQTIQNIPRATKTAPMLPDFIKI